MKKWFVVCLAAFSWSASPFLSPAQNGPKNYDGKWHALDLAAARHMSLPVALEPNVGQADSSVDLIGRSRGLSVLLTRNEIIFAFAAPAIAHTKVKSAAIRMQLAGGRELSWRPSSKLRGETNYFLGNDPAKWRAHVPHFARAEAANALPGVSMIVYGAEDGVEYDLRLAPEVDPSSLRLAVSPASRLRLDANGDLLIAADRAEMRMKKPAVFQERPGIPRKRVQCQYLLEANNEVGFRVGPHDSRATLILDPSLSVAYSSFIGGTGEDSASSIALDSSGDVYVGGTTTSPATFPGSSSTQIGPGLDSNSGPSAAEFFIAKLDPTASGANSLVYLTFLGGSATQAGGLIAVDGSGNVGILGTTTSADFPVTDNSLRTTGPNDVTLSEIDSTGGKLLFSTIFGGSGSESTQGSGAIAFDKTGDIFAGFDTTSADLQTTAGAFDTSYGGGTSDGFLAIFHSGTTRYLSYGSYFGINGIVGVTGMTVDPNGAAYVTGFTSGTAANFPLKNAFQTSYGGDPSDAFLMKMYPLGGGASDLIYASLLGGNGKDQALAVALDAASPPNVYITGTTQSTNFPTNGVVAAFQTSPNPYATSKSASAFLTVIAQGASGASPSVAYSTYLGGSQTDAGRALAVSAPNEIYVAGATSSWDFPWRDNLQPFNGQTDAFIAKLDPTSAGAASLIYATPLGGTAPQGVEGAEANAVAADASGHVYVAGRTTSADFPTAGNPADGFQLVCGSCQQSPPAGDGFVVEVQESAAIKPSIYFGAAMLNFQATIGTSSPPQEPILLRNGGEAPLNISSIQITGPNSSDFRMICPPDNCSPAAIPAGGSYSLEVAFDPTLVARERAFLSFTDDAPGSPQELELYGAGLGPLAQVSPMSVNFGSVTQGTESSPQSITLHNAGTLPLTIANISPGGQNPTEFPLEGGPSQACPQTPFTLPAGDVCIVSFSFLPASLGSFSAEIDFIDNSGAIPGAKQAVLLSGVGIAPAPIAQILPATAAPFGTVAVGTLGPTQTFTLTNTGSAALNLASIAITGANAADFEILMQGVSACPTEGGSVVVGGNCTVAVQFAPQSSGAKTASLVFADNAASSPQTLLLTGAAISPAIQLFPSSLTFQGQNLRTMSAAQSITITNAGNTQLAINGVSVVGTNAGDFSETNNCPANLAVSPPGNSCVVQVTFFPSAVGSRSAAVSVADNAAGSPHTVTLTGTGTQPSVSLAPTSADLGSWLIGANSPAVPITLTNNGTGSLGITKITISGTNAADFGETDNCSGPITVGGSCAIQTTFKPGAVGARSASIVFTDNAPDSPQSIALTGTGGDFSLAAASSGSASATVTAGQTANYQLEVNSLGTGSVSLSCSGAPSAATCTSSPGAVIVAANAPGLFQVSVTTTANSALPFASNKPRARVVGMEWQFVLAALGVIVFYMARIKTRSEMLGRQRIAWKELAQSGALAIVLAVGAVACGGGAGGGQDPPPHQGTPAGTYSLTVTGTSGSTSHTMSLTLTVQ
jgi:hypothetical protein